MRINGTAIALAMLVAGHSAAAQDQPPNTPTILECIGDISGKGINAPADVLMPDLSSGDGNTYTVNGNLLTVNGGSGFPDVRLQLCQSSDTAYVYQNDCTANRQTYVADWLAMKDFNVNTSPFYKKYKNSGYQLQIVSVDRVSLHVHDESLSGHVRNDVNKAMTSSTLSPYLIAISYTASCKIVKPKI